MSLVDDIFDRVKLDEKDSRVHNSAYDSVNQIAKVMDEVAPDCDDKTLAFRALHSALMHFGAALTHQSKYRQE